MAAAAGLAIGVFGGDWFEAPAPLGIDTHNGTPEQPFATINQRSTANHAPPAADVPYRNASLPVVRRVEDLLARMTWSEKVSQLTGWWKYDEAFPTMSEPVREESFRRWFPEGVAQIGPSQLSVEDDVAFRNAVQKFLREQTRLGIPVIFHDEGCHGVMKPQATSFPMPIGLACSWNEGLTERIYDTVAREMRLRGGHQALTPILDVARDPRWGRIEETMGEDPVLVARLGAAMVRGFQGGPTGVIDEHHVLSTLKHFAGHGTPEGGLNRSPSIMGSRELRDVHLAPFKYVIEHARPAAVMPSYNDVDGVPSHANRWLMRDVLRGEYNFRGLLVSDYGGIERMHLKQLICETPLEAGRLALAAGVDCELSDAYAFPAIRELTNPDPELVGWVDAAVRRMLTAKFQLGLFENPYADAAAARAILDKPETSELAVQAARESIVLLKNDGNALPLDLAKLKRIAVIGPNADIARFGGYSGTPLHSVSLLDGIRAYVGPRAEVVHAEGCRIVTVDYRDSSQNWRAEGPVILVSDDENRLLIDTAVSVAAQADVVVLALGDLERTCRETWGEASLHLGDRASLDLPGSQMALARAVIATGKPVIVYLMNGRPAALEELSLLAPAILEGWYAGQATGTAAAEILFGRISPSGKLTVSFPRDVGHIPAYYSRKTGAAYHDYLFSNNSALYSFGHGLSYTTFEYRDLKLATATIRAGEQVRASVEVVNTGKMAADEIVQLYLRDEVASVTRPVMELRDFRRIPLQPGESRTVEFTLAPEALLFTGIDLQPVLEPGKFQIMVGGSTQKLLHTTLTVTP
ncbi:MAG: glycoside hydrolase family 3 N-terminal domain-containing protein [Lacunisphaera sp.]|nr:glycoside hydrolase family 3 N-terminal domain-containing protein [Lacunisphaera sp.]